MGRIQIVMLGIGFTEWLAIAIVLLVTVFWIKTLIDVVLHEPAPGQRLRWAIVILLTWAPGALLYALLRGDARRRASLNPSSDSNPSGPQR